MTFLPRKNIVVPIDNSEESFTALSVALDIAEKPEDVSVVMVISDDVPVAQPAMAWGVLHDDNRIAAAKASLTDSIVSRLHEDVSHEIRVGDPGTEIIDYANQQKADLIVMPSHGRRGISRLLLGSVAERVLRLAHCPVLVLRGESSKSPV
ncbi:MAG: universal stress protein [bacterium]|nr:universal stress protein [bacterium]